MQFIRFESKVFVEPNKMTHLHQLRRDLFDTQAEIEKKIDTAYREAAVRYTIERKSEWIEETFENEAGAVLTVYQEVVSEQDARRFVHHVLSHFGFFYGIAISESETSEEEQLEWVKRRLVESNIFQLEDENVVLRRGEGIHYVSLHPVNKTTVLLKLTDGHKLSIKETEELTCCIDHTFGGK